MFNEFKKNKEFYMTMLTLSLPVASQNFISSMLSLIASAMVGQFGEVTTTAVALAMQYSLVFIMFIFGICGGATIFIAQYWGAKNRSAIQKILGITLIGTIFLGLALFIISAFFPEAAIGIFIPAQIANQAQVVRIGADYLRTVSVSFLFTAVSMPYIFALRAVERPIFPLIASGASLVLDTSLSFILLFGMFGAPRLGVHGVAIATVVSRAIELIAVLVFVAVKKDVLTLSAKKLFTGTGQYIRRYLRIVPAVMCNEGLWGLGVAMYSMIFGHISTDVVAAANVSIVIQNIAIVFFVGLSSASAVMVGKKLGEGKSDVAYNYGKKLNTTAFILGIFAGAALIALGYIMPHFYHFSPAVNRYIVEITRIIGIIFCLKTFNYINIVGILRSGGKTLPTIIMDVGGIWLIGLPLGAVAGLVLKLPISLVIMALMSDEVVKFIIGIFYFRSKKWIKTIAN